MESEAPARDFSRLSICDDPPPPSKKFQPLDFSQLNSGGSMGFIARRNCTNFGDLLVGKVRHKHLIKFYGNYNFTVDGGPERDATDPININIKFMESIKNYKIPEEFGEDGLHTIMVLKRCQVPKLAAAPKGVPPGSVRLS